MKEITTQLACLGVFWIISTLSSAQEIRPDHEKVPAKVEAQIMLNENERILVHGKIWNVSAGRMFLRVAGEFDEVIFFSRIPDQGLVGLNLTGKRIVVGPNQWVELWPGALCQRLRNPMNEAVSFTGTLNDEADIRKALTDGDIWIKAVMVVQEGEDHRVFRESEVELRVVIQNIQDFDR